MTEEPVVFEPKIIKPRLRITKYRCAECNGAHAPWWKSTPPPTHAAPA